MATSQESHDFARVITTSNDQDFLDARLLEARDGMKHDEVVAHGQLVLVGRSRQG